MDSFLLFKPAFLHGLFFEDLSGVTAHYAFRIAAVHDMMFMQLVRLLDWYSKLFGNLDLFINGGLLLVKTSTIARPVKFITRPVKFITRPVKFIEAGR
jgi:hypothetical protein